MELGVKLAFITGFPDRVSTELKQVKDFDVANVGDLITEARVLVSGNLGGSQDVAVVVSRGLATVMRRHDPTSEANGSRGGT